MLNEKTLFIILLVGFVFGFVSGIIITKSFKTNNPPNEIKECYDNCMIMERYNYFDVIPDCPYKYQGQMDDNKCWVINTQRLRKGCIINCYLNNNTNNKTLGEAIGNFKNTT